MPRHDGNNSRPVLKIKYRMPGKLFRTKLTLSGCVPNAPSKKIVSVKKISLEQIDKVGEYWKPFRGDDKPDSIALRRLVKI